MSELQIDTEENCSFLDIKKLEKIQEIIKECKALVDTKKNKGDILKAVQKYLTFDRVFKSLGVQGITGILKTKKGNDTMVFKVSIDLDKTVEHENLVTSELNKLRPFCPHFVGNLGMITLPISNEFINNPSNSSLFTNSNDYFPCNVMLAEYVSPISLYHVCKYMHHNKSIIISQLIQIIMALIYGQKKCNLTHYDCHLDNVLIRTCEENALFLYKYKGKNILVPTYGLYPVIIDLGSSYVKATEGKPMYTNMQNYHNGLQPTLYDNFNDIHHLLLSVLYYLEEKGYVYDFLRTRIMYIFRHVPIMANKGWKQLPHNVTELIINKITEERKAVKNMRLFATYGAEIIDILNGLIILPWAENANTTFDDSIDKFFTECQKIADVKSIGQGDEILYIIRETVELIHKYGEEYKKYPRSTIVNFSKEWKTKVSFIVSGNLKEIPKDLNFETIFTSSLKIAQTLSSNYYEYIQTHVAVINDTYSKMSIKKPLDIVYMLMQNATPSFKVTKTSKVYVWDSDSESRQIHTLDNLSDSAIDTINNSSAIFKGNILASILQK